MLIPNFKSPRVLLRVFGACSAGLADVGFTDDLRTALAFTTSRENIVWAINELYYNDMIDRDLATAVRAQLHNEADGLARMKALLEPYITDDLVHLNISYRSAIIGWYTAQDCTCTTDADGYLIFTKDGQPIAKFVMSNGVYVREGSPHASQP